MPGFTPFKGQAAFGWRSEIVGGLRLENYCSLHNRAGKLPTPHVLGRNREGLLLAFSGVPNYDQSFAESGVSAMIVYDFFDLPTRSAPHISPLCLLIH